MWKKNLRKLAKSKNDRKVRDHCYHTDKYRSAAHSICNLKFNVCNEIPVAFQKQFKNWLAFYYKRINKRVRGKFECLVGNAEKYKPFSVTIVKSITKIDKVISENVVTISCKIEFIDSPRFMASSLSSVIDIISEGVHKVNCKDCSCFLEYESVKDVSIKFKCTSCKKFYLKKLYYC